MLTPEAIPRYAFAQVQEGHGNCTQYGGASRSPRYSIERQYHSDGDPRILNLYLSLETKAFGGRDLINLACKLRSDFPKDVIIHAWMFDDKKAAKNLALRHEDQEHYIEYLWHLKAHYELDRLKGSEFIEFLFPELQQELPRFNRIRMLLDENPTS